MMFGSLFIKPLGFQMETIYVWQKRLSQPAFTCSKLTIEKLEQGVKYVQS